MFLLTVVSPPEGRGDKIQNLLSLTKKKIEKKKLTTNLEATGGKIFFAGVWMSNECRGRGKRQKSFDF